MRCISILTVILGAPLTGAQLIHWETRLVDRGSRHLAFSSVDRGLYVHGDQSIQAIDTETGEIYRLYDHSSNTSAVVTSVVNAVERAQLFLITFDNGDLVAYDPIRDEARWTYQGVTGTPLVDTEWGSAIYVHTTATTDSSDMMLVCLDSSNGMPIWRVQDMATADDEMKIYLSNDNSVVYTVSAARGSVNGYNASTGAPMSKLSFERMHSAFLVDKKLYFYNFSTLLGFTDDNDKYPLWANDNIPGTKVLNIFGHQEDNGSDDDNDFVLVHTDYALVRVNTKTGNNKWTYKPRNPITSVVSQKGSIYVVEQYGDDIGSRLVRLNPATGGLLWMLPTVDTIVGNVVVVNLGGDDDDDDDDDDMVYYLTKSPFGDGVERVSAIDPEADPLEATTGMSAFVLA